MKKPLESKHCQQRGKSMRYVTISAPSLHTKSLSHDGGGLCCHNTALCWCMNFSSRADLWTASEQSRRDGERSLLLRESVLKTRFCHFLKDLFEGVYFLFQALVNFEIWGYFAAVTCFFSFFVSQTSGEELCKIHIKVFLVQTFVDAK